MMNLVPEKHKLQHSTLINLSNYFDNRLAWFSISFPSPELGPSRLIAITGALEKRSNTAGFVLRRLLISPQYCHLVINEALLLLQPHREQRARLYIFSNPYSEDNCPEQPLHHVPPAPTDFVIREKGQSTLLLLLQDITFHKQSRGFD